MSGFRSLNNSTSKRVLNLLEPVKLTVWKVMVERVTVVKFRVNYRGGNGAGCFEVEVWDLPLDLPGRYLNVTSNSAKLSDHLISFALFGADSVRYSKGLWSECTVTLEPKIQFLYLRNATKAAYASRSIVDQFLCVSVSFNWRKQQASPLLLRRVILHQAAEFSPSRNIRR